MRFYYNVLYEGVVFSTEMSGKYHTLAAIVDYFTLNHIKRRLIIIYDHKKDLFKSMHNNLVKICLYIALPSSQIITAVKMITEVNNL